LEYDKGISSEYMLINVLIKRQHMNKYAVDNERPKVMVAMRRAYRLIYRTVHSLGDIGFLKKILW
jgi:hypothetical protein